MTPQAPAIDGRALLDEVRQFVARFCVMPSAEACDAVTLWIAATHGFGEDPVFDRAPRLWLHSPQRRCGKTRVLEVIEPLVWHAISAGDLSPSSLFRLIAKQHPTLLLDEVDVLLKTNTRTVNDTAETMRGILNNGFAAGKPVWRSVGPNHEPTAFNAFGPVLLAGIGTIPDTLADRSIRISMRRRLPDEDVERWRSRRHEPDARRIGDRVGVWIQGHRDCLANFDMDLDTIADRAAEKWEPLLAVADLAGGHWPERARRAAEALERSEDDTADLGITLLADLHALFSEDPGTDWLPSAQICTALIQRYPESGWSEILGHKQALTPAMLANLLRPYGVSSANHKYGTRVLKSYSRHGLADAWSRYLPTGRHRGPDAAL